MFEKLIDRVAAHSETIPVCDECGPIRRDVTIQRETRNLRVMCQHQEQAAADLREREAHRRQLEERIAQNIRYYQTKGAPPDQYAELGLGDVDERHCSLAGRRAAEKFVATWHERLEAGHGLTLSGDIGTGKTMVAVAIANTLVKQGATVRFLTVTNMQAKLKRWDDANDIMDDLKRVALLVLDDFGQERVTEWSSAQLFDLLDARYQAKLPTILTTNLGGKGLREHYIRSLTHGKDQMPADQAALTVDRVLSRLRQRNVGIVFSGADQRIGLAIDWLGEGGVA